MIAAIRWQTANPRDFVPWADQFSPIVGIEVNTLLLDVTGLPFNARQVAEEVNARVGFAETIGKAWALANYDEPLPVESLRLPSKTIALLKQLGLHLVSELERLPRDQLATRFPEVIHRLDQFSGVLAEPVLTCRQEPGIVVERDLEYPVGRRDHLDITCSQLIEQVAAELESRQQGALRLEVSLDETRFIVGLFHPRAAARHLWELVQSQLDRIRLAGPVSRVRVRVLISARLEFRQRALFVDDLDRQRQLATFVDRISCRTRVLRAVLVPDAQPEYAFRYEPLTNQKRSYRHRLPPRPLLVEPRPVPIEAISVGSLPAQFTWRGEQHRIVRLWGPERIQTGWWRHRYVRRDYFRVETPQACYWLFRSQGRWFLHGVF